jgi:ATP-binding cassette subfamily B protein
MPSAIDKLLAPVRLLGARVIGGLRRRRVPVVLQMDATECAAACLAMVLGYHGREVQIAECRDHFGSGRDGVSARTMVDVARGYGMRVRVFSAEMSHFDQVRLPAIVYWNFNHFVVVERLTRAGVEVVDPAFGRRTLTHEEFGKSFTGVAMTLEPGVHFARSKGTYAPWRAHVRHLLSGPGLLSLMLQVAAASLLLPLLGLALPLLTKVIVDHVLALRLASVMTIVGVGILIVTLAQLVAGYLRSVLLIYLRGRFDAQMMVGLFEHLLQLPLRYFQQRTSGDLLMRLGSSAVIREMLTNQSLSLVLDGVLVLIYLALLLFQAPLFGVVTLAIGLVQVILLLATTRQVHDLMQRHLIAQASTQSFGIQALEGIATLKASGSEGVVLDYWSNLFFKELNISLKRNHLASLVNSALSALRTFSPMILLWFGAMLVLDGQMQLGTMLAYNAIALAFLMPLASLVSSAQQLQLAGAHLQRMADVIEAEPEQDPSTAGPTPRLTGRIELENVSFRYGPGAAPVLHEIDLTIEAGQKVALVGRTGSGKSTLALLLLGLYAPTGGEIRYDGIPLQRLNLRMLRNQFGVVLQEPLLFSGSIRENVALNDPTVAFERIVETCKLVAIHDEIQEMPMKYETWVSGGGGGLSGGQRQRLSLARALAPRPSLLLLDEATSSLDVATEAQVDEGLSRLDCTRIVIAHRLSTIRNADVIVVLDGGRIVERGTHDELVMLGGRYAGLVNSQMERELQG